MGASNTPLPDLIELQSLSANTTFTGTPGGGGDIIGVVDNATYTDDEVGNSATNIGELNESTDADSGWLMIDGITYSFELVTPLDNTADPVTVTHDGGLSQTDLYGDAGDTQIAFLVATPVGPGAVRYFAVVDDSVGDLDSITSLQTRDLDWDPAGDDVKINVSSDNNVTVCFAAGTRIAVPGGGTRPVETLTRGDLLCTADDGAQPLLWVARQDRRFPEDAEKHRPVHIGAGTLGPGVPTHDLVVSPQHRICISGPVIAERFNAEEVLVPAKGLLSLPRVRRMNGLRRVSYFSLLMPRHSVLIANGARAESFYPGPIALRSLSSIQRTHLHMVLARVGGQRAAASVFARPVVTCGRVRRLIRDLKAQGNGRQSQFEAFVGSRTQALENTSSLSGETS
ncbi:Hint domain-containing protein [Phaeobacter gallaeciensis]|uniref:Hint domain-containing protein n=1 Tax=Phaeobacter gallaeciensis TaxID=60890 RepID=A0ABD4X8U1_9RHOB|nr:Hint domain-containing protein [Phaeobacter gallaeciensis]MDE4144455.1 Hint domain-containing protein [Phaeobacter gallaeciensis]MDE4161691.1 Hint domain-containing protein [Phaeobacter gallaeciensis]MDE4165913.1 Hint domain-containing protein [Phaeobacter gallaeciensis]MDE4170155.1 Hint domain-containing protein [Phaeobacter gallaeciensis]MDE4178295.1 Hint domain-containing protein [Phaeobacter gallaeciensis]